MVILKRSSLQRRESAVLSAMLKDFVDEAKDEVNVKALC